MGRGACSNQEAGWNHHRTCQKETEHGDKYIEVIIRKIYNIMSIF